MKTKRNFLFVAGVFFLLFAVKAGTQHGVLLPEKQEHTHVHADGTVCNGDHHHHDGDETVAEHANVPLMPVWQSALPFEADTAEIGLRRKTNPGATDLIGSASNVDSVFGAGESAVVTGAPSYVTWPYSDTDVEIKKILIGSNYSKNAVVGIYDYDGEIAGNLRDVRLYDYQKTSDSHLNSDTRIGPIDVSVPTTMLSDYSSVLSAGTGSSYCLGFNSYGAIYAPFLNEYGEYEVVIWNHITGWPHGTSSYAERKRQFTFTGGSAAPVYTSTKEGDKDDGETLLFTMPGTKFEPDFEARLKDSRYYRPTTVLLRGKNVLDEITVGDVAWYAAFFKGKMLSEQHKFFKGFDPSGCTHYSGWICYYRTNAEFSNEYGNRSSGRYVDAAVRLLDNANVYVSGNVEDISTNPLYIDVSGIITTNGVDINSGDTENKNGSDVLLVLPGEANSADQHLNFRLMIGGDANMLHTQDVGYYVPGNPLLDGYLYRGTSVSSASGTLFPERLKPVYLTDDQAANNRYTEVEGLRTDYIHPNSSITLTDGTRMPYIPTNGSVYGVRGRYMGDTDIHTQSKSYSGDTTAVGSVIEIGSATNNQDKFHIYSKGILKNFRVGGDGGDRLVIGNTTDGNKAPGFTISNSEPLYILNDGKGVNSREGNARIIFNGAGVDSIQNAIEKAKSTGALHIQANSDILFNKSVKFEETDSNDIKILSDHGSITVAGDFAFSNVNGANLTLFSIGEACNNGSDTVKGSVTIRNTTGATLFKTATGKVIMNGFAYQGESGNLWIDGAKSVDIITDHNGADLSLVPDISFVSSFHPSVYLLRPDGSTGNDTIRSENGHVYVANRFIYKQDGTANSSNLTLLAKGDCDEPDCIGSIPVEGDVELRGSVSITNVNAGTTTIQSTQDQVKMGGGFAYTGAAGKLLIDGARAVEIKGDHDGVYSPSTDFSFPSSEEEGVYIVRKGTGSDLIRSGGHIYVEKPFIYEQNTASALTLLAQGACYDASGTCGPLYGYVRLGSSVSITNKGDGTTTIQSELDTVSMGGGFAYTGEGGRLLIDGKKSVNIRGSHNDQHLPKNTASSYLYTAGYANEGVYILREGGGGDTIYSEKGHVYVEFPFIYEQTTTSHLTLLAGGDCDAVACDDATIKQHVGGNVTLDSSVTITNVVAGTTTIQSTNAVVEMKGGFAYTGVDGNLLISGYNSVSITGQPHNRAYHPVGAPWPPNAGDIGVYIKRTGTGLDSIYSAHGGVHVQHPIIYKNEVADSYLTILAEGDCGTPNCAGAVSSNVELDASISIEDVGDKETKIQSTGAQVKMGGGFVYSGKDGDLLIDGLKSVTIRGAHDGNNLPNGIYLRAAGGGNEGVYIYRIGDGNDTIHSGDGHIYITSPFTYWQNPASSFTDPKGLTLLAGGECKERDCGGDKIRGYVMIDSTVITKNETDNGYVTIESKNHHVTLKGGMIHEGKNGELNIRGDKSVDILNGYNWSDVNASSGRPDITVPTVLDSTGMYIYRAGTADDSILSAHGHIRIQYPFTYDQVTAAALGSGLTVWANGECNALECNNGVIVGGYVIIDSAVTTTNVDSSGFTTIRSGNHYVKFNRGFAHTGVNGNLLVSGHTRVDINGEYPADNFHSVISSGTALPKASVDGSVEGVYILRKGKGHDSIKSDAGHVMVANPLTFIQDSIGGSTGNGLSIWANGKCDATECPPDNEFTGGYVWLKRDVNTTNQMTGPVSIWSEQHYVRIGEVSASSASTGGHVTHNGVSGNFTVLAKGACYNACGESDADKPDSLLLASRIAHPRRGYVWIGDDVDIRFNGTGGTGSDSNAVIRSYADIVQLDDSVTFTDTKGANLWVNGKWGVRTLGPTFLTNNAFDNGGIGNAPGVQTNYVTTGQGFVTYLSDTGYVDFGKAPNISNDSPGIGGNTPFAYTAKAPENALLVEGYSRVFFGDSTTITMDTVGTTGDFGNAKIYSPAGWIKFADTLGYTGTNGNLVIYANGIDSGNRSCWDEDLMCDAPYGGFVLFDSITEISYAVQDTGITWIRSNHDDVVIGDMFTYASDTSLSHPFANGEFIMQAAQDIYGKSFEDTIHFIQRGDSSILLEAKKTIHLQQMLHVDREKAKQGDITLKAGYPSFAEPSMPMASHAASHKDEMPTAMLSNLTWPAGGDCVSYDYTKRFACKDLRGSYAGSETGGDIWFEGRVLFDLTQSKPTDNTVQTTLRAFNSIFIDSTFVYQQNVREGGDVLLYAEVGNIEAAVTRQDNHGYVADDTVLFDIQNTDFNKEIRIQAGNRVWGAGNENSAPTNLTTCWKKGDAENAEYNGNILYNKPFIMQNKGKGYTILSAARDIETQVMAPFIFTYDGAHLQSGNLDITAGRHIETHAKMQFNYPDDEDRANVTLKAGRLDTATMTGSSQLCKTVEEGTTLATGLNAFDPDVKTGGVSGAVNNAFAAGGKGHGSILLFDSLEFNYDGSGRILLVAENGNIESDPYLHKDKEDPSNPGNQGAGYSNSPLQHDAQVTFNHGGSGVTQLKAIDIKLHDKIAYFVTQSDPGANYRNGQFHITAYDSILTRNLQYVNHTDTGSVFITTAKYKSSLCDDKEYDCTTGGPGIHQGHIILGYGADCGNTNVNDSIIFDYNSLGTNSRTTGGNIHILAGFEGFEKNRITGKPNNAKLFENDNTGMDRDKGKGYGGNITFDYMEFYMPVGSGTAGGFTEIRTPNGNIWGKDSILYRGFNGNFLVDAGQGSADDTLRAVRWDLSCIGGSELILNTQVPDNCGDVSQWRTGNIMMKGATLNFGYPTTSAAGTGDAIFRTREGFIDTYDAFTVDSMAGDLVKYAGMDNATDGRRNNWGDVSERDFRYTPVKESGSVFFGADDNIMLNYGNSNGRYTAYGNGAMGYPGLFDVAAVNTIENNPYYYTSYEGYIEELCAATFNVNKDGYLFYHRGNGYSANRQYHYLYRGCTGSDCSGVSGECKTSSNGARDLMFNFDEDALGAKIASGGVAMVASNYIDLFTKFTYLGGEGRALGSVPGTGNLHGEQVSGYGLYIKSQFNGEGNNTPEKRRATCEDCDETSSFPIGGASSRAISEMTYIGFHDDARIHTQKQKSLLEAPVIEFFGHTEMDTETDRGSGTKITLKGDSLVFHDSVIFDGGGLELLPYTTDASQRTNDMRYGVINDRGSSREFYSSYGPAIEMEDRNLPVVELGYQRCYEPPATVHAAPNSRSLSGKERTPAVGGDIVVAFKHGYSAPLFNTVVANHARISFISDSLDGVMGGEYVDAFIRADLLRIRNKVEFYTDPQQPRNRTGKFVLATPVQMDDRMVDPGMYTRHLHMEPGSELSIPSEDSLIVIPTTVVGGYGNIHENVFVKAHGILAPGFASLMEGDCQTLHEQGTLTVHNLQMEKDAVLRVSIGSHSRTVNGETVYITQTDVIAVEDTVFFTDGKVSLEVLPEMETLDEGCYTFLKFNDSLGISREYVKNFILVTQRYRDTYFALDFSERGRVNLCVTRIPMPEVQRYVELPAVEGVTTDPEPRRHYVKGHEDFTFTARYAGLPLKVLATGFYSGRTVNLDKTAKSLGDNTYQYTLYQIVEPWTVFIGPEVSSDVSNESLYGTQRVWSYRNTLYIKASREDIVSIYNMTGVLEKRVEIPEGLMRFTLERGLYVVTLKDGSIHKIVIR